MMKDDLRRLSELGVATVYEASGREGLIDIPLIQLLPGSRVAGPARTVLCGQDDNLMVHAVIEQIQPGEVLVLSMPKPSPVALIGELLATQVKVKKAAGILVDAAVRDTDELVEAWPADLDSFHPGKRRDQGESWPTQRDRFCWRYPNLPF
jgi:4-hydroxy-4-methyl-2-oxoglutarate aldolase